MIEPSTSWLTKARQAGDLLNSERQSYGSRLETEEAVAGSLNLRRSTLRSYLEAARVIEETAATDRSVAELLENASVDVVRAIGRWARRDAASAHDFIRRHPSASRSQVLAEERLASEVGQAENPGPPIWEILQWQAVGRPEGGGWGGALLEHLRLLIGYEQANKLWADLPYLPLRGPGNDYENALSIEAIGSLRAPLAGSAPLPWYELPGEELPLVAYLHEVRFRIRDAYRHEAKRIQFRAMALTEQVPIVMLPLPDEEARREFVAGMISIPPRRFPRFDPRQQFRLSGGRSEGAASVLAGRLLIPAVDRGAIVMVTPETVFDDIYAR